MIFDFEIFLTCEIAQPEEGAAEDVLAIRKIPPNPNQPTAWRPGDYWAQKIHFSYQIFLRMIWNHSCD